MKSKISLPFLLILTLLITYLFIFMKSLQINFILGTHLLPLQLIFKFLSMFHKDTKDLALLTSPDASLTEPLVSKIPASPPKLSTSSMKTSWVRWVILALASIINFALNYSSNNPQALQPSIQAVFGIEDAKFNLLYSVYSTPNIILPLLGGLLADYIGVRFAVNLFGFLVFIGQGVFTLGAYYENFELMVLGRFVFGLGGESLTVTQLPLIAKWFNGEELAFAYGFAKSAVRFGKAANSFFTPKIYLWTNSLSAPLFTGLVVSLISLISGLVFCQFDKKADSQEVLSSNKANPSPKKKIDWKDFKSFPKIFYLMLISYACMFAAFTGVSNPLNKLFVTRFGFDENFAGNLVMLYYVISAIAGPLVGFIVEKYGRETQLMLLITLTLFFTNLSFAFLEDGSPQNPNYQVMFPLIGVTVFSSFYTILFWAGVAAIIDKRKIGLGTGMITCVSNLSQTILPLLLGAIHDSTIEVHFGYFWTFIALCGVVGIGFVLNYMIHREDKKNKRKVNLIKQESQVAESMSHEQSVKA